MRHAGELIGIDASRSTCKKKRLVESGQFFLTLVDRISQPAKDYGQRADCRSNWSEQRCNRAQRWHDAAEHVLHLAALLDQD